MNNKKYLLPAFAAVFALMFAAATPYVIAEPGQGKDWDRDYTHDYPKKDIRKDMAEKLNLYCEMSSEEQIELIEKYNKTEEMVSKMNEYCSLDEEGRQAFIEEHKEQYKRHHADKMGDKYSKHHHMIVEIDDFTGTIKVPDMSEVEDKKAVHQELKEKVTVKLSKAAAAAEEKLAGLDVIKGSIGMVVNEDGIKSVAWILVAKNMDDADPDKMSKTIFVVDATNVDNTAQVTKEYDHSKMDKRYSHGEGYKHDISDSDKIENKIAKIEQKLNEGNLSPEQTENKVQFVYLLRQLQTAIAEGDNEQADSLRDQLQEIRNKMIDLKKFK